ncbi:LemA family protein [Lacticaseibacillus camelliae]|uniref:Membrane protein LemA n=1 Tax=Lacticaseibacillus camelliae DSM 22697 = JCM 13995 TaxID=1423730 RepID=A0A0R2FBP2_9LACO|nr:LemA family protein [Lacticaseibacillus camelliae]KRN25887.1 membrane protein LemA [Lacticaseibacillus camelliae DSM 22697 = JCM 13995]
MQKKKLSPLAITWIVIAAVAVIVGIYSISTYNSLQKQNQAVEAQWSQVENVMQRRADLVPNLVSAVKGSMKHEDKIFGTIAKARENYNKADTTTAKAKADDQLNSSVGTLVSVIQEQYPTLASNENVQTLMTQLEGSENRISVERKRYIEDVRDYNQSVVTFPKNLFASMMGLGQKPTFKANPGADQVPKVNLGD